MTREAKVNYTVINMKFQKQTSRVQPVDLLKRTKGNKLFTSIYFKPGIENFGWSGFLVVVPTLPSKNTKYNYEK